MLVSIAQVIFFQVGCSIVKPNTSNSNESNNLPHKLEWKDELVEEVKIMAIRQPRYSKEEFAQRGDDLYESQIRSKVEEGNHGKIVAIDIETGAFEVAEDIVTASEHFLTRLPDAQTWFIRIGHQAVYHFGARSLRKSV
jgi:hypothetical protein